MPGLGLQLRSGATPTPTNPSPCSFHSPVLHSRTMLWFPRANRRTSRKTDPECIGGCAGEHGLTGPPNPGRGKGDRFHVHHTPPDSASSPAFQRRNQGVFLFIKQSETKTTFIPNKTISNSQTKRGGLMGLKCSVMWVCYTETNKSLISKLISAAAVNRVCISFPVLVTRGR